MGTEFKMTVKLPLILWVCADRKTPISTSYTLALTTPCTMERVKEPSGV